MGRLARRQRRPRPQRRRRPGSVAVSETALGRALTDRDGRTLYTFTRDKDGRSSCHGNCAATWPALTVNGTVTAGRGLEADRLATAERKDGTAQITYRDMPLYYYAGDTQPGDTNGQGVGGVWLGHADGERSYGRRPQQRRIGRRLQLPLIRRPTSAGGATTPAPPANPSLAR